MNTNWKGFLASNNATINDGLVTAFKSDESDVNSALTQSIIADQSAQCYIEVSGEDATLFLQGQLSNDINLVDEAHTQLSSYSTPKGRMLAIFKIFSFQDKYYLLTSHALKESLIKRLRMFVMMSKVDIVDASDHFVSFSITGDKTTTLDAIPSKENSVIQNKNYCIINSHHQIQYFGLFESLSPIWTDLVNKGFIPVGQNAWHITTLKQGIPAIYPQSSEAFIPQHTNLDNIDAINFKKGCYTGQEVIARLHYLGKQKRKMYLCSVTSKNKPQINDALVAEAEKSKQGTGNIVDVASLGADKYLILAILNNESLESNIFLKGSDTSKIQIEAQPYTF